MKKTDYNVSMYAGNLYHVYNRGNGTERIFFKDENYYYFLKQFKKYMGSLVDAFANCLLPNHFHLLVKVKINSPEIISESFRKFFISYSMSINKQECRKGSLLQRGFKRKLIEDERYFYAAIYYIHANAVHHGMVRDIKDYRYSSYNDLTLVKDDISSRDVIFEPRIKEEIFNWFGGKEQFISYHEGLKKPGVMDNFIIEEV